jgi:hypothetical protein
MSGAAGLAAARRRRGNPQPAPQRMNSQQQPPPVPQSMDNQSPNLPQQHVGVGVPQGAPQTPMTILHQHHIKLEEHDKVFNEINERISHLLDSHVSNPHPNNMELTPETLEQIKITMIDPLENDLQNVLSGYQLKIDMLTSTMNAQQNYILELNTTLLGVVNQMTKLLAMKENEISTSFQPPQLSSVLPTSERNMETYDDLEAAPFKNADSVSKDLPTEYFASDPPVPFISDSAPTFGYADTGIPPTLESIANNIIDVDAEDDSRNIMDDVIEMVVDNQEDPERDLSVE